LALAVLLPGWQRPAGGSSLSSGAVGLAGIGRLAAIGPVTGIGPVPVVGVPGTDRVAGLLSPAPTGQSFSGTYTGAAGTRAYAGHVPSAYHAGTAVPLVVALHGCTQSADDFRKQTRLDDLAEAEKFVVVYPEQARSANPMSCWNWFRDADMVRGQGEPAIIAGITQWVQQHYSIDAKRTYVTGFSAGAAMANVMGATYPDLYGAIGVGSGIEYDGGTAALGGAALDPKQSGQAAFHAMGPHARVVPALIFHGGKDQTVPVNNAEKLVQQWLITNALAEPGTGNVSLSTTPASTRKDRTLMFESYTVSSYNDQQGREILQYWLVPDMDHAWSGGCSCRSYSYPSGPDEAHAMYDFFMRHPMV
jgi:poly(hydroxyalkanoate) depolymerase family esterase